VRNATNLYLGLREQLLNQGYVDEITWAEEVGCCSDALTFAEEAIWVILCSGLKEQVARTIWARLGPGLKGGEAALQHFHHEGKAKAIDYIWRHREVLFSDYRLCETDEGRLCFLRELPWVGRITCYHLARNLGMDVCKPDRHLTSLAEEFGITVQDLCGEVAQDTGHRIGVVDVVFWRAANLGLI